MKSFKALAVACLMMTTPIAARPGKQSCESGTYQCVNSAVTNGTSTVQVCGNGSWLLAAVCETGQKCFKDAAGGCVCQ